MNMLNKKITWRKQHKWLGIGMSFFMLMFCLSGILLNHRSLIKDVDVSRKYLPSRYEFKNWNGDSSFCEFNSLIKIKA